MSINNKGDTIVEVPLATTVLSAILFTSWSIVNRASQISMAARQRVYMVDQLKEQAEIIESYYLNDDGKTAVSQGVFGASTLAAASGSDIKDNPCEASRTGADQPANSITPTKSYYFNEGAIVSSNMKSINSYDNARLWVQRVPVDADSNGTIDYNDFFVQSCWVSSGGTQQEENSKIIVRLNT
mgnify:CR=1 FL=1